MDFVSYKAKKTSINRNILQTEMDRLDSYEEVIYCGFFYQHQRSYSTNVLYVNNISHICQKLWLEDLRIVTVFFNNV